MSLVRMSSTHRYQTSKDYQRLFELAKATPVVCFVDFNECRDVASTRYSAEVVEISARGITYLWADSEERFIEECLGLNVEFLEPSSARGCRK